MVMSILICWRGNWNYGLGNIYQIDCVFETGLPVVVILGFIFGWRVAGWVCPW